MAEVVIWRIRGHNRSLHICEAMERGIRRCGADNLSLAWSDEYARPIGQVAVFYGLAGNMLRLFHEYQQAGLKTVYVDLGYWERTRGGKREGYHKVVVNGRHPTAYFQDVKHDGKRAAQLGRCIELRPWRAQGAHVVVAGMSPKAAGVAGLRPEEWDRRAISTLRQCTNRPIIYRPKPSWKHAQPITGTTFSNPEMQPRIEAVLEGCWALVTHHSNAAVDALVGGVPTFCEEGVALPLSRNQLEHIEDPVYPDGREQWVNDIAYTQFSAPEMRDGVPWRHLKDEGLIP